MGEKMTLEDVRDWHRKTAREKDVCGELRFPGPNESPFYRYPSDESKAHDAMADAIDAHLTQPAQAVDVGECDNCGSSDGCMCAHWGIGSGSFLCATCKQPVRTAALPNANGKEG